MSAPALLGELSSLAAQVIGEEVSVVSGEPGCMWSWNWKDREITVCPEDLSARSADVCRAVLMHECAHAAITRIYDLLDRDRQDLYRDLLNILEDIRIEAWLAERFPGCAPWLALANRVFGHEARKAPWPAGQQLQFLKGLLEERWFGDISPGAAPEVVEALAETRDAVAEMARCIPPPAPGRAAAREILHSQQAMLAIFLEKIVPVWERLVRADLSAGLPRHTSCDVPFLVAAGQGAGGRRVLRKENTAECARDYPKEFWPFLDRVDSGVIGMPPEKASAAMLHEYRTWERRNKKEDSFVPDPRILDCDIWQRVPPELRPFLIWDDLFERPGFRAPDGSEYEAAMSRKATKWWNGWIIPQVLDALESGEK